MNLDVALDLKADLAEGPIWDAQRGRLLFVDIMRGEVHALDPASGEDAVYEIGQPVGAVTPTVRGDWMTAVRDGFMRLDPATGATRLAAIVEDDKPDNRMNDGYCDARGRFWAGTMSTKHERGAGALFRMDPDGRVTRMLGGVTTSNGIDWSLDHTRMYYVDTGTLRIDVFDFDLDSGEVRDRRPLVSFAEAEGKPDGLIVDADGCVWIALWGGAQVRRYTPDGRLDRSIPVPATYPTKCAFGGDGLADLFITSARRPLTPEETARQPLAGSVLVCRPGVTGRPPTLYGG